MLASLGTGRGLAGRSLEGPGAVGVLVQRPGPRDGYRAAMILELAILDVRAGESPAFEAAFAEAKAIIAAMPGFRDLQLQRCLESEDRYVLLVGWDRLEDHTVGFRESPEYQRWRALLHQFYEPFPIVEHYEPVFHVARPG
jgi:heme-degrading monooxygenase HmoA